MESRKRFESRELLSESTSLSFQSNLEESPEGPKMVKSRIAFLGLQKALGTPESEVVQTWWV